jgi:chromosome segregation protein
MRLKKLIVHGFKSFADRTEFVFDSPITGIVGPNGCGKSNVVDAFKWVLGEQSAKSLRGHAMLDVIFNGSGSRKPSGMAEVVLVFENPKHADGNRTLNLDVEEVSVGRQLFRDGNSEYRINNQPSRLKDIRELFLDTGVGVDAYSVIEQGRVSLLLESNPQERRLIFEEAAGISKFKARRKESQRKLERVDQNLLRVNDIVEEVDKRLRGVRSQAGKARSYQELSTKLTDLRLSHSLYEFHHQDELLKQLGGELEDTRFRLDDASGNLSRAQADLGEKRQGLDVLTQARQQVGYELVQAEAALQSARQGQEYANRQLAQIAEQMESLSRDRELTQTKQSEIKQHLAAETARLAELTESLEAQRKQIADRQAAFSAGQLRANSINQQIEQNKQAILDLMRRLATVGNRLGAIDIERKNAAAQQDRLSQRRAAVEAEIAELLEKRQAVQKELDAIVAVIADRHAALEARKQEAAALGRQIAAVAEQLGSAREHRSGLLSRQKLLADLEAKREGVSEGVKSVLRQREQKFPFIRGLVADVLRVDVEHAQVIEAALDGRDQLLLTADSAAAQSAREMLEELEGRVSVLCTDLLPSSVAGVVDPGIPASATPATDAATYNWNQHGKIVRLAIDLVRFEPADAPIAQHLLGRTVVVEDLTTAMELWRSATGAFRYITNKGETLESDGTLRAGPMTAAMGLLSRRAELEALVQQIAEVDGRIAHLASELHQGNAAAAALEEQQKALQNEVYRANTVKVELTGKIAQSNDRTSALTREQPVLDRELAGLAQQVEKLQAEREKLTEQRQAMEVDQADRQKSVEAFAEEQVKLVEELKHTSEALTACRVELGQVQEKQLASRQQVQRHSAAEAEVAQQLDRLARSADSIAAQRESAEAELEEALAAERRHADAHADLTARQTELVAKVESASSTVNSLSQQVESLRAGFAGVEQALHGLELKLSETRVRNESLVQRTRDELNVDLPERYRGLFEGESAAGYQAPEMDWDAVAAEIDELRERIGRLGNVNLDAIGEQDELEQRQNFLQQQVSDLANSKNQLESLIDEINSESSVRFAQTFEAVREHFQGMFRKLFGGGKADIYLETEIAPPVSAPPTVDGEVITPAPIKVDPLDAGIEIIARPPGKQPVSISQLSGGEKTMTCVALLLSIFKSKPSPFCILDEVDAALDEANNQRFNLIVQEFLEQSQFIIITHSKRTMQVAEQLYGVTMQEQGVSKRVAVKFDQVDNHGRISETAAA